MGGENTKWRAWWKLCRWRFGNLHQTKMAGNHLRRSPVYDHTLRHGNRQTHFPSRTCRLYWPKIAPNQSTHSRQSRMAQNGNDRLSSQLWFWMEWRFTVIGAWKFTLHLPRFLLRQMARRATTRFIQRHRRNHQLQRFSNGRFKIHHSAVGKTRKNHHSAVIFIWWKTSQ